MCALCIVYVCVISFLSIISEYVSFACIMFTGNVLDMNRIASEPIRSLIIKLYQKDALPVERTLNMKDDGIYMGCSQCLQME